MRLAFMLLLVAGCDDRPNHWANSRMLSHLTYAKDSRTGLCYAMHEALTNSAVLTCVPCTAEVEREITAEAGR